MTRDDLIETLAGIEHERWADWQKHVHSKCREMKTGQMTIPPALWDAWERQILMPYAHLSDAEKQADRDQVARYWPVIVQFVNDWLMDYWGYNAVETEDMAQQWREDMA